jgi:hypothetical protein
MCVQEQETHGRVVYRLRYGFEPPEPHVRPFPVARRLYRALRRFPAGWPEAVSQNRPEPLPDDGATADQQTVYTERGRR